MEVDRHTSLEEALARTESDADAALKAASVTVRSLKKFRAGAKTGNLRELRKTIEAAEQAIIALTQQFKNAQEGWNFDEDTYLSSRTFPSEILETAEQMGVRIFERDDRLYCYPFLIRLLPNERSVMIDKARERRLRPSVLVSHLKELQNKPVQFKSGAFLEALSSAYSTAVKTRGKERLMTGAVVPLVEIYGLLTLLPGQSREYSRQEFARDLYLLDQGDVRTTKNRSVISLHAASGRESANKVISIVTKDGKLKRYYGISFAQDG